MSWRRIPFLAVWCALTASGIAALERYAHTPGAMAEPPATWPGGVIARAPGRATIALFAHPRCPCTRASLRELARVMARVRGRAEAWVLFYTPDSAGPEWTTGGLWDIARGIPGVRVLADREGRTASRLRAHTSGQVVAYDAGGRLVFHGGITASRGHEGDSAGEAGLIAALGPGGPPAVATVFGCALERSGGDR